MGLHFSIKTHEHWFWSSIWWDPKGTALASDRPASIPYQYQMCAVSDFNHELADQDFSNQANLRSYIETQKTLLPDHSWCSNPYLEHGTNNHKTNCIGCHQFAGEMNSSQQIEMLLTHDPMYLIQRQRDQFHTDYTWAINFTSSSIQHLFRQTVEHFRTIDP